MSSDPGSQLIPVTVILVCVLFNAFAAASKRALDYVDRNAIKEMHEEDPDDRKLTLVMELIEKPSKYHYPDVLIGYVAILISLWMFNLMTAQCTLKENIIANLIFFILYIGIADVLPKKLAAQASEEYAVHYARFQRFVCVLMFPLVKVCVFIANIFLVLLRKETDVDNAYFSEKQVMSMIDRGQESGEINEEGRKMIDSIFAFDDLLAYEIMKPRTDVFMIDADDDKDEYFDQLMELRYTRIPVYEGDPDHIIGILHIKDYLLKASYDGFDAVNIRDILRAPYFVPETKNIDSLFVEMQKEKHHIAILIDEYGGFSGIVSVEDIIEQIVGDIDDEYDEVDRVIEKTDDDTYVVDGNVYLDDLGEETGIEFESDNSETIGGFLIEIMGEIPKEFSTYEPIEFGDYVFNILEVKDRRIVKVRIEKKEPPEEAEDGSVQTEKGE